jgi:hypothetical protein
MEEKFLRWREKNFRCRIGIFQREAAKLQYAVTPAKAIGENVLKRLDSRFRGNDITGREKTFSASYKNLNERPTQRDNDQEVGNERSGG